MDDLLLERPDYQSVGKVDWIRFGLTAALSMGIAATVAAGSAALFYSGCNYLVVLPVAMGLVLLAPAYVTIVVGRCRSPRVATLIAIALILITSLGHYYFSLIRKEGIHSGRNLTQFLQYISFRAKTDRLLPTDSPSEAIIGRPKANASVNVIAFLIEVAFVTASLVLLLRGRSRRAFCDTCQRWKSRFTARFPPGTSQPILDMLRSGQIGRLGRSSFGTVAVGLPAAQISVEICQKSSTEEPRCAAYLTVRDQSWVVEQNRTLRERVRHPFGQLRLLWFAYAARQIELTDIELAAFRSTFPELRNFRVGSSGERHSAGSAPVVSAIDPSDAERKLAKIEPVAEPGKALSVESIIIENLIGVLPAVLVPIPVLAFAIVAHSGWLSAVTIVLLGVLIAPLALAPFVQVIYYRGFLTARWMHRLVRRAVERRPDRIVDPWDPEAIFVDVIPPANWGRIMLETASDIGFLRINRRTKELLFEGDRERYQIPADAIRSCRIESFESFNLGGAIQASKFAHSHHMVVLETDTSDGPCQIAFWHRPIEFRRRTNKGDLSLARDLQSQIDGLRSRPHEWQRGAQA